MTPHYVKTNAKLLLFKANLAKFSQNQEMRVALQNTGNRRIVEASPDDKVWGIGLNALTFVLPPLFRGVGSTSEVRP